MLIALCGKFVISFQVVRTVSRFIELLIKVPVSIVVLLSWQTIETTLNSVIFGNSY